MSKSLRDRYVEAAEAAGLAPDQAARKADLCMAASLVFRADAANEIEALVEERKAPVGRPLKRTIDDETLSEIKAEGVNNHANSVLSEIRQDIQVTISVLRKKARVLSPEERATMMAEEVDRARQAWNLDR
jgi:hypothetical protein